MPERHNSPRPTGPAPQVQFLAPATAPAPEAPIAPRDLAAIVERELVRGSDVITPEEATRRARLGVTFPPIARRR